MTINTKFNIEDSCFYMSENKVTVSTITAIKFSLYKDGSGGIYYTLSNSYKGNFPEFKESELFSSKEELINSL